MYETIRPYLRKTPVVEVDLGEPTVLKLEQMQCAGSFKVRGAFTNLLLRDVPAAGVAADPAVTLAEVDAVLDEVLAKATLTRPERPSAGTIGGRKAIAVTAAAAEE